MPKRIKDYASAATTIASDDYFAIDGATNGTRKTLLTAFGTTGLLFGAGTAAAPKLAVGTSSNGIYAPSGNTLGFSTNGAQQWRIDSFGTLVSDVQSTPVVRFQPALPGTTCGIEWFDTGAVLAAYAKYNVTSPQLEINAGKSGSTGRIVFYTNTTDVGRFTSSQCFLVGTTSETGLTGAAGMKVASTTLATSGSTGALVVAGSAGFGKKCFITDGSTGAQLRLEYTATSVYTDLATLSTGHFLMTTTGGNRITSTTTNDTSVLARQVQGGLAFDGVTTSAKDLHTIAAVGTSDMSFSTTFVCPSVNPSVSYAIACSSTSTSGVAANSFVMAISAAGLLYAEHTDNAGNERYVGVSGFVASYGGKLVTVTFTKSTSGNSAKLYINGLDLGVDGTVGSPGAWSSLSFTGTNFFIGYVSSGNIFSGTIYSATLFNRALSASEVIIIANQGVQESDKWGSLTAKIGGTTNNGNFEAGAGTTFTSWGVSGTTTITVAEETVDMHSGTRCPKITGSGLPTVSTNNWFVCNTLTGGPLVYGKRYTYSVWLKRVSGTDAAYIGNGFTLLNTVTNASSWLEYTGSFTATASVQPTTFNFSCASGSVWLIDDVTVTEVGAILDADLSAGVGYQVPDRSSNKYHGVVSASGTSWTLAQRRGQLRATTSTPGNERIFSSQVCLPTNAIITSIVGYTTGTPTVYVGNVSGGSQLVASVAMSASTYTSFTLAAITSTTGNVWVNSSTSDTINWTITYMIADP